MFGLLLVSATASATPVDWAEVEPIPGAEALVVTGESTHVVARIDGQWFVTTESIGMFDNTPTVHRAFDATLLAKQPAIALVVESRDGGSEMGIAIDQLVILCAANEHLRKCGEIQIGQLEWTLDAENRRKYPGAAFSLRKRPHVEVELEPKLVAPDMLRLRVSRSTSLSMPSGDWESETVTTMNALKKSAGLYRFVDDKLVRVN